ncbi:hypothetical protein [Brevundimonas goettingensis]|uniref:hypothetical protein n=1 Tax=Brevundimonas goettingensis TaxID=2774190 RepID=UPI001A9FB818|nr:hypothetical protein [Brevundimonas goettingensis]
METTTASAGVASVPDETVSAPAAGVAAASVLAPPQDFTIDPSSRASWAISLPTASGLAGIDIFSIWMRALSSSAFFLAMALRSSEALS